MVPLDWNELIKQLLSGTGLLAVIATLWITSRRGGKNADKETINKTTDEVITNAEVHSGRDASNDLKAITIAHQAMGMVESLKKENEETKARLTEVESQLGIVRKAYDALYWKWQDVKLNWEEYRESINPPDDPDETYHP